MIQPDDVSFSIPEKEIDVAVLAKIDRLVSAAELIRDAFEKFPELEKLYDRQFQLLLAEIAKATKGEC
jgi:hypothetical protein